jgi:hypothetical protein
MDFESVNQGQTTQWPKEKNTKGSTKYYLEKDRETRIPLRAVGKLR